MLLTFTDIRCESYSRIMGDPLPPDARSDVVRPPPGDGTVLLLNFNVDERDMYRDALVAAGYDVITCVDPFDVLRVAASRQPEALVTRIHQPNCSMDGVELIRMLRASRMAGTRIIVTASLQESARLHDAREAGCDVCLLMPASAEEVVEAVSWAIRRDAAARARSAGGSAGVPGRTDDVRDAGRR